MVVWWLDLQLPMQSVPITTKVVNSNPVHGEMYSTQHYVITFASDLRQVGGFLRVMTSGYSMNPFIDYFALLRNKVNSVHS